jgi:hypothetical protein
MVVLIIVTGWLLLVLVLLALARAAAVGDRMLWAQVARARRDPLKSAARLLDERSSDISPQELENWFTQV